MRVENGKFVTIEYWIYLKDEEEAVDFGVLTYCHGNKEILPRLEKALEGLNVGDTVDITLSPSDAFGEFDENLVKEIPLEYFEDEDIKPGQFVRAKTVDGSILEFTVLEVSDNKVYADFNHPMAGETLRFKIKILEVNDEEPKCCCGGDCCCS